MERADNNKSFSAKKMYAYKANRRFLDMKHKFSSFV